MPDLSRRDRLSAATRLGSGRGGQPAHTLLRIALLGALGAGACVAQALPSPPRDVASASTAASLPAAASAGDRSAPPTIASVSSPALPHDHSPDAGPTPIPGLQPSALSLAAFTVICESWGAEPAAPTIDCGEAAALALGAIGAERAGSIRWLDVHFGDRCTTPDRCTERRPDVGSVVARSASFETLAVRVAIDPNGSLEAWPPVSGAVEPPPAFTPPPVHLPDLGTGLPARLRDREPAPLCGAEDLTSPDGFSTSGRACFLGGVRAGVPVELVSRSVSTEGDPLLTLYRFTGRGAVLRYVRAADGWTAIACGISSIPTSAVFILAGTCERLSP